MTENDLVETIERQLAMGDVPTQAQTEALLQQVRTLTAVRDAEQGLVVQARLDQRCHQTLVAAHEALVATHRHDVVMHRHTADALQETEARFRAIFEAAAIGIALGDLDGRPLDSNPALQEFLGYRHDELAAMTFLEFTHPDDVQADYALYQELLAGQRDHYQVEKRYVRKDGRVVWGRLTVSLIRGPRHMPLLTIGMVEDITARKQAELALCESEARGAAIVNGAIDCIITMDQHGRIVEWNPAAERTFGYGRAEVLGRDVGELIIPPDLRERYRQGLARYFLTGEGPMIAHRGETTGLRADGSLFPVEVTVTRISVTGPPLFTGYLRDISERKQAEETERFLADASRTLAATLDYATTLAQVARLAVPRLADCCAVDVLGDDHTLCRQALAHVDPAKEEVLRALQERSPLDPQRLRHVARVLETGRPEIIGDITDALLQTLTLDPEQLSILRNLHFRSAMVVPLIAHGRTLGTLVFTTADSGRHYQAHDLVLAQELASHAAHAVDNARLYHVAQEARTARDAFLAIAAHELKRPLTTVVSGLRMLEERPTSQLDERTQRIVGVTALAATQLNQLVDSLTTFVRIEGERLHLVRQPLDLKELAQRVLAEARLLAPRHELQCIGPDEPLVVAGDAVLLEVAIRNLLQNAIKYSPAGGHVDLCLEQRGSWAIMAVQDEGLGIATAEQARLFERFYRGKSSAVQAIGGLGVGLYVVDAIVRLHGGSVAVDSREGAGSRFTVTLPL